MRVGTVEFIEKTVGVVENEDVTIAGAGVGVAFDVNGERNRHGAGVGFAAVGGVVDRDERLRGIDDGVGSADVRAVVEAGAEVGMNADARSDVGDDGAGVGINGHGRDVLVPEIVRGERKETIEARARADRHCRTIGSLLRAIHLKIETRGDAAAGIGILDSYGIGAGDGGRADGGELCGGDECCGENRSAEEDLRAVDEVGALDG